MAARPSSKNSTEKALPAIVNQGYFSEYFLAYRLDAGLADLYKRWEALERSGDPTPRTRVRGLSMAFDKSRADASLASPDVSESEGRLDLELLPSDGVAALRDLNDEILAALGWEPMRGDSVSLISGERTVEVPVAHRCDTPSGLLLLALETVFATDPTTVVAEKEAASGTLLDPVKVGEKAEARTVLEAAQLIFTADDPPTYLLVCSGGAVTLLDRERWGEGVFLGADLDDAVARGDTKPKGELAAIAALFGADTINPGTEAQSVLTDLLDKAANESAGVSKELRHGVRRSVELLANAVVRDVRHRQKGAWRSIDPDELTRQCLRYLYRIIVLLFAEARPDLGILPVNDPDYQAGYSLARLRDTALTDLHSDHARNSTHVQESLALLFRLVNDGYDPPTTLDTDARGLSFPGLGSSLFSERSCPMLDRAEITDETLQQVLVNLCFTREKSGRQRQALSYATLGINQLGAVYEGLMAYKGFLATEELFEIDNDGDPDNGSWVIPVGRADEFPDDVFLKEEGPDGQERRVRYQDGDFVFRLSGRDRQRSASYYTPEVLTEFTVRHTLDVYWEEHPDLTAADILKLNVCEPALGSGAFLNEAINQLAARYLKAAQDETGETIDPDRYQLELQKTKAHFAMNQAYGVDLNPTAVELAEVSLWLNCMHEGLKAPRFGARLRRGNSLIGARRAAYTVEQIRKQPWKSTKNSPAIPPTDQPLHEVPFGQVQGIHHFLLPGEGWGSAADATELKGKGGNNPMPGLAENWCEVVRDWRRAIHKAPSKSQLGRLRALSSRVESAWEAAARDAVEHHQAHVRHIELWGLAGDELPDPGSASSTRFSDPEGPVARLRMAADAWCALWLWAPANASELPSLDQWLDALELLLGQPVAGEAGSLFSVYDIDGDRLDSVELFGRAAIAEIIDRHRWLRECASIAERQGFFHWELEHSHVAGAGGFEIQLGNPPWVRPTWDEPRSLAEANPWFGVIDKQSVPAKKYRQQRADALASHSAPYQADLAENIGLNELMSTATREPLLNPLRLNLYLPFLTHTWRRSTPTGVVGLLHPEAHYIDPNARLMRSAGFRRLRRHWQFANELFLFEEIHHATEFSVNVYGSPRSPSFLSSANLLVPATLDKSLDHDGSGDIPGIQHASGGWDVRPHRERVVVIDKHALRTYARLVEADDAPPLEARLMRPATTSDLGTLDVLARQSKALADFRYESTPGFHELGAKVDGTIEWRIQVGSSLDECILQGPHILNAKPFGQQPKRDYKNNTDWEEVDLESLPPDFVPRTNYQPAVSAKEFVIRQAQWAGGAYSRRFRETHRQFVGPGSVRTLQSAIIPPGVSTVGSLVAIAWERDVDTVRWSGLLSSLPYDYLSKVIGNRNLKQHVTAAFPVPGMIPSLEPALLLRTLRLNCVTEAYADLWESLYDANWHDDRFVATSDNVEVLGDVQSSWSPSIPLRRDRDRWAAGCELDALAALLLGVSADQLSQMYRSQFAVLRKYESQMVFDGNGRQICGDHHAYGFKQTAWEDELKAAPTKRGEGRTGMWDRVQSYLGGHTAVDLGPFIPPFRPADRERAMRGAHQAFTERLEAANS